MDFTVKKIPLQSSLGLLNCPVHTVRPFALMLAPVYVFMRRNSKFVAIKAPLDFFTPDEIDRFRPFQSFFFSPFVKTVVPYRDAGCRVRAILSWQPRGTADGLLAPSSYEISDAILRVLGTLWGNFELGKNSARRIEAAIEPFFASVLVNEICEFLPEELMKETRDQSIEAYDLAVFRSSLAVFLALHLGYCEWDFLNRLRTYVFYETASSACKLHWQPSFQVYSADQQELVDLAFSLMPNLNARLIQADWFRSNQMRASQKLASRLERIQSQLMDQKRAPSTIFGPEGIIL